MTAARIGPAHGAQTNPSAAPTPTPVQEAVAAGLGPNRASRDSGACTRCASSGMSSTDAEDDQHARSRTIRVALGAEPDTLDELGEQRRSRS